MNFINRITRKVLEFLSQKKQNQQEFTDNLEYWDFRTSKYGHRAVFNISHTEEQLDQVTKKQKSILYPLIKELLNGSEKMVLDYGCGTGRFTDDLAELIKGNALGIDPMQKLISLSKPTDRTKFLVLRNGEIPLDDKSVDLIFICLVFGGIKEDIIDNILLELKRVLKNDGLVVLIENTSDKESGKYWYFRDFDWYKEKFRFVELSKIGNYFDVGEEITIMSGRKIMMK